MSILSKPYFHNETAAIKFLEGILWADGTVCPHCGCMGRVNRLEGKTARPGLWKCYDCRKQFTVKVGTVFESSHIPVHKWLQAAYLIGSSKKGFSAHQLSRTLEITYKSAWFMFHRLREAMKPTDNGPMGGEGKIVQVDETYFGTKDALRGKSWAEKKGLSKKMSVVGLISGGKARTFHVETANAATVEKILRDNVKPESELHTDESRLYHVIGKEFADHQTVKHSAKVYVRHDGVHTNTIESYFSVFKRGMRGVYQHCSEKHLNRYLAEFDLRYNERDLKDTDRTQSILMGAVGKRLTYKQPVEKSA